MQLVLMSNGIEYPVLYDEQDHEFISSHKWHISHGRYVNRKVKNERGIRTMRLMHRDILGITDSNIHGEHRNRNGFDNRRENLRIATRNENFMNRGNWGNSKYKGVTSFQRKPTHTIKYTSRIQVYGKCKLLGIFHSEIGAALAYDAAAEKHFGEFAKYNFNRS